jgi:hypothetical protein
MGYLMLFAGLIIWFPIIGDFIKDNTIQLGFIFSSLLFGGLGIASILDARKKEKQKGGEDVVY